MNGKKRVFTSFLKRPSQPFVKVIAKLTYLKVCQAAFE